MEALCKQLSNADINEYCTYAPSISALQVTPSAEADSAAGAAYRGYVYSCICSWKWANHQAPLGTDRDD